MTMRPEGGLRGSWLTVSSNAGRILNLFIASDEELWGTFDATTMALDIHSSARAGDEELLDRLVAQTRLHDGVVYAVEHARVLGEALAAAIFRSSHSP